MRGGDVDRGQASVERISGHARPLDRLDANAVGVVVIGTRLTGSPYYAADGSAAEAPALKVS